MTAPLQFIVIFLIAFANTIDINDPITSSSTTTTTSSTSSTSTTSSTSSSSSSTTTTPFLAIHSSDCLACTLLASFADNDEQSTTNDDVASYSQCCTAVARVWPARLHECVTLCDQLRLLRRQQFVDVECEMLSLCRFNEQKRLSALHRVRDERSRLALAIGAIMHRRDEFDATFELTHRDLLPPPPPPPPPPSPPAQLTDARIDALKLEQLVRLEEMQRNVEREAVRLAQERIDNEKRLAAELVAERERERNEAIAARARAETMAATASPPSSSSFSSDKRTLSTTTWPYTSSPTVGAVLWSALSDCFWLPLLLLWFLVDYVSDRVTTHYLAQAFETEHPVEMETIVNRFSALFVAAQRAVLAVACMRALSCSCEGDGIFDALFAFRWDLPSIGCLHSGDGCWLHFVVAVTAARCATALVASVRTFMSYWSRQRVWQWLDSMVWLTDAEKPTNVLVLVLLVVWPSRWKLTVALVTVYTVSSIVDALTSVALDLFTKRTMEDMMSMSWWHVAIMAHKVLACWLVFSHIQRDANDDATTFAFIVTLMLLTLTAGFARAAWKKLLPKRKFATD
jgi:hypothetical protein